VGQEKLRKAAARVKLRQKEIRAADAKEVGVGNPAEETYCYPNDSNCMEDGFFVNWLSPKLLPGPSLMLLFALHLNNSP
jgi:hypothetical protein